MQLVGGVATAIGYNSRIQLQSLAYTKNTTKLLELAYSYTAPGQGNNRQIRSITDSTGAQEAGARELQLRCVGAAEDGGHHRLHHLSGVGLVVDLRPLWQPQGQSLSAGSTPE